MKNLFRFILLMTVMFNSGSLHAQDIPLPPAPDLVEQLREIVHPFDNTEADYDRVLSLVGDAQIVLIGEASHGTHEFYRTRAEITQRLIEEKGFTVVAVEADWPDAYRVNHYVRGESRDDSAEEALSDFQRFPLWMWRNTDVRLFVEWLREYNETLPAGSEKAGFYGMDLYSLYTSTEEVVGALEDIDPQTAALARQAYTCFEAYQRLDPQYYGQAASRDPRQSCEDEAANTLIALEQMTTPDKDDLFYAEQNARVVRNSEAYYRSIYEGENSWNVRDQHMMETLGALEQHFGAGTKIVVWAHNSHIGDARATERARVGELNLGQLVREHYGEDAFLIGFSTYTGTVMAASEWDAPGQLKQVNPGMEGSYELLFHQIGMPGFLLSLDQVHPAIDALSVERLERAIGVIYLPETERWSHYFNANLPQQFDALIFFDVTQALEPLDVPQMRE